MVGVLRHYRSHILEELGEEGCEQSRTSKTNLRQSLTISLNDAINSDNFRVCRVSIHGEAVAYAINSKMTRNATKTENWEASVSIIWFNDCSDIH